MVRNLSEVASRCLVLLLCFPPPHHHQKKKNKIKIFASPQVPAALTNASAVEDPFGNRLLGRTELPRKTLTHSNEGGVGVVPIVACSSRVLPPPAPPPHMHAHRHSSSQSLLTGIFKSLHIPAVLEVFSQAASVERKKPLLRSGRLSRQGEKPSGRAK